MKPGYQQIYSRYRDNITRGILRPGDKVPAIRVLAAELKVARKTVETAYAILSGEGYLVSQGARGTRVNPDLTLPVTPPPPDDPLTGRLPESLVSQRERAGFLRPGIPALDSFPYKKWLLLAGQAVRAMRQEEPFLIRKAVQGRDAGAQKARPLPLAGQRFRQLTESGAKRS